MSELIKKLIAGSRDLSELDLERLRRSVLATYTKAQLVEELCSVIDQRNALTGLLQETLVKFDAQLQCGGKAPINLMARIKKALSCAAHAPTGPEVHESAKRYPKGHPFHGTVRVTVGGRRSNHDQP